MAGGVLKCFRVLFLYFHFFQGCYTSIEEKKVIGGGSFSLTCAVKSASWLHKSEHVPVDHEHHLDHNGTYIVNHATERDSGLYTCRDQSVYVNVTGLRLHHHLPPQMRVLEHFTLEITVPVLGLDDSAVMTWKVDLENGHGNDKNDISKLMNLQAKNNTMTIVNATTNNTGSYTFEIAQKFQMLETATFVEVLESVQVEKALPRNVSVNVKNSVMLECLPDRGFRTNVTWYRGHDKVVCAANCSITIDGLHILRATEDMAGEYSCIVADKVQITNHSTFLIVKTPPKALYVEVKQLMRSGYVNVSWDVVHTGGYPIQEFILHAFPPRDYYSGDNEGTMLLEDKHKRWLNYGPLDIGEDYRFEMWARNRLGDGEKVWVNFTYTGPGNYTIATAQVKPNLFFNNFFKGKYDEASSLSHMQQTVLSSILALIGLILVGGLACKVFCRMERSHAARIQRRLRQDSEASDVLRLGSDDTPRAPHAWSFRNPIFDENIFSDMPPMATQMAARDIPADSPPTYDSLEQPFQCDRAKPESNKPESLW